MSDTSNHGIIDSILTDEETGHPRTFRRVFAIVCDSMGFGAAADAAAYGDAGSDTIGHAAESNGGLHIPNLERLGTGALHPIPGVSSDIIPAGKCCLLAEESNGKDTLTGHWEMMGIVTKEPFVTFTNSGFPLDLVAEFERRTGRHVIGNKAASGTAILDELACLEQDDPSNIIMYTSADSVLQLCGDENGPGGLSELYRCCEIARELTLEKPEWRVARVIARPYVFQDGKPVRTSNRKDYSVAPPSRTVLDELQFAGIHVKGIGKIGDIFSLCGITTSEHSDSSAHGMEQTIAVAKNGNWNGFCFTNLSDFDVLWGHRRDPLGYAREIELFDDNLGRLMDELGPDDLLVITADHGNDPTSPGTDHTREDVPFIAWSPAMTTGEMFEKQHGFHLLGRLVAENFEAAYPVR